MKSIKKILLILIFTTMLFFVGQNRIAEVTNSDYLLLSNTPTVFIQNLYEIPKVDGQFIHGHDNSKVGFITFTETSNGYSIKVKHPNGANYILASSSGTPISLQLPNTDIFAGELILNSGKLFKGDNDEQLIYYEFQRSALSNDIEKSIFEDNEIEANGIRPYVIWNFLTGEFDAVNKLTLYAVHHAGTSRRAFADVLFPMDIDELLFIEMKWHYRYHKLWGALDPTEWREGYTIRYADEEVSATSFWNEFKKLFEWGAMYKAKTYDFSRFSQETIQDLGEVSIDYKTDYVKKVNKKLLNENKDLVTVNDLFNNLDGYSLQRVYLDTYDNGLWTGYDIADDISLIDIGYIYKGEYYHPVIDDIEWTSVGGSDSGIIKVPSIQDFLAWLVQKFKVFGYVIFSAIIIVVVVFTISFLKWFIRLFRKV